MKKSNSDFLLRAIVLFFVAMTFGFLAFGREWKPDRYLPGFQETTVDQGSDYSGPVDCTVVRKLVPEGSRVGVLYVHGFNDYFFQQEMGDTFVDSCYNFYAVDLRKYGRSLKENQKPYSCRNISEYYADLDSALSIMHSDGIERVVLMGHSTGGLVVASYMNHHPDSLVRGVILNSPFLEWNMGGFLRKVGIPLVTCIGRWWPNLAISQGDGTGYAESLLKEYHGEWQFDTNLKTVHPRKVTAGWIRAITEAQRALHNHSFIACPVLLMHSDNSVQSSNWDEAHQHGDAVLNVADIAKYGRVLGPDVTEDVIKGGLHDLILSEPTVRAQVYHDIFSWLRHNRLTPAG